MEFRQSVERCEDALQDSVAFYPPVKCVTQVRQTEHRGASARPVHVLSRMSCFLSIYIY